MWLASNQVPSPPRRGLGLVNLWSSTTKVASTLLWKSGPLGNLISLCRIQTCTRAYPAQKTLDCPPPRHQISCWVAGLRQPPPRTQKTDSGHRLFLCVIWLVKTDQRITCMTSSAPQNWWRVWCLQFVDQQQNETLQQWWDHAYFDQSSDSLLIVGSFWKLAYQWEWYRFVRNRKIRLSPSSRSFYGLKIPIKPSWSVAGWQ